MTKEDTPPSIAASDRDAIIQALRQQQLAGVCFVSLAPENLSFIQSLAGRGAATRPRPLRKSASPQDTAGRRSPSSAPPAPSPVTPLPRSPQPLVETTPSVTEPATRNPQELRDIPLIADLAVLGSVTAQCSACPLCRSRSQVIAGAGDPGADLMFVADGPSTADDQQGGPLRDASGELFDKILAAMNCCREDIYITHLTRCAPGSRRPPSDDEALACLPFLKREIELVRPRVIVLMGGMTAKLLLNKSGGASLRGMWHNYNGIRCMPIVHPSYLLRVPTAKREVWSAMKEVMSVLANATD